MHEWYCYLLIQIWKKMVLTVIRHTKTYYHNNAVLLWVKVLDREDYNVQQLICFAFRIKKSTSLFVIFFCFTSWLSICYSNKNLWLLNILIQIWRLHEMSLNRYLQQQAIPSSSNIVKKSKKNIMLIWKWNYSFYQNKFCL